jgi:hypothetical protein
MIQNIQHPSNYYIGLAADSVESRGKSETSGMRTSLVLHDTSLVLHDTSLVLHGTSRYFTCTSRYFTRTSRYFTRTSWYFTCTSKCFEVDEVSLFPPWVESYLEKWTPAWLLCIYSSLCSTSHNMVRLRYPNHIIFVPICIDSAVKLT